MAENKTENTERLDTLLRLWGCATKSEIRQLIAEGRIEINGVRAESCDLRCLPGDRITVNGILQQPAEPITVMLNKPAGYVSTESTVLYPGVRELIKDSPALRTLEPIGRLDADTTGLLLLTNNGMLNRKIERPENHVSKTYLAVLDRPLPSGSAERLAEGIVLNGGVKCSPASLEEIDACTVRITVTEGKNHEVKRLMLACGARVASLHRESIGGLTLDPALKPGEYRRLTQREIMLIFNN